jgi:hypothetical protein
LVVTQEPPLPSIALLARPEEKLAGVRFDPALLAPSRLDYATSLVLQRMATGERQEIPLPDGSEGIRYVRFHPSRPCFAFASKAAGAPRLDLHRCALADDGAWRVARVPLGGRRMNFVCGCAFQFAGDGASLLVKVVPEDWPAAPPAAPVSTGPAIQAVAKDARKAPGRTYQGERK